MGRNTVKKQIFIDTGRTVTTLVTVVRRRQADKMAPNPATFEADSSRRIVNDLRTNEPVVTAQSPGNAVDECLAVVNDLPSARRKNPTAAILPQVDMMNAIEHQGSMLYEKHKGQWVVEFISESSADSE